MSKALDALARKRRELPWVKIDKDYSFFGLEGEQSLADLFAGHSVFTRTSDGGVAHSYSCYGRGLDIFNGAYQLLDMTPKGRDEDLLPYPSAWLRRHDQYGE